MNGSEVLKKIEPEAAKRGAEIGQLTDQQGAMMLLLSSAISAKRTADALERIAARLEGGLGVWEQGT